ncbi:MAG: hypothetical protein PUF17_07100 [Lactimicrobium massiliense]|nr:hypothetical protein [Lactimicrobium massiliense]MDD6560721.1 hypothetical protein [Lactimicrobium massiliense]
MYTEAAFAAHCCIAELTYFVEQSLILSSIAVIQKSAVPQIRKVDPNAAIVFIIAMAGSSDRLVRADLLLYQDIGSPPPAVTPSAAPASYGFQPGLSITVSNGVVVDAAIVS